MDTAYLYSGTLACVRTSQLLTDAQRELLLATTTVANVRTILEDTPFAPYLTPKCSIREAAEQFLIAQVEFLKGIIPDQNVTRLLLLRHDYYNLKQIAIGKRANAPDAVILATCRPLGTITPTLLLERVSKDRLQFDEPRLGELYRTLIESPALPHDSVDKALLSHLIALAEAEGSEFLLHYVQVMIDLHNLLMRLRVLTNPDSLALEVTGTFVPGGSMTNAGLATLENVLDRLDRFGGPTHWREAREVFLERHDFSLLDRAADNYLLRFLKTASLDVHSPASVFAYYHAVTEHVQFISAIESAHAAGITHQELRRLVRHSLLTYAY